MLLPLGSDSGGQVLLPLGSESGLVVCFWSLGGIQTLSDTFKRSIHHPISASRQAASVLAEMPSASLFMQVLDVTDSRAQDEAFSAHVVR